MTAKIDHTAQKARVSEAVYLETIDTCDPSYTETQPIKLYIPEQFSFKPSPLTGENLSFNSFIPVIKLPNFLKEIIRSYTDWGVYVSARQTANNRYSIDTRNIYVRGIFLLSAIKKQLKTTGSCNNLIYFDDSFINTTARTGC